MRHPPSPQAGAADAAFDRHRRVAWVRRAIIARMPSSKTALEKDTETCTIMAIRGRSTDYRLGELERGHP